MMDSVITALKDTPIPTILVIAGIVFLLLSIAGRLAGRIEVPPERQRWAAMIGGGLLVIGVALHVLPQGRMTLSTTERMPVPSPPPPAKEELPEPPAGVPSPQPTPSPPEPPAQPSTEEKEPNNHIAQATLVTEGTTVRGSIATREDWDFFKFNAPGTKTRIILRKRFTAYIDIYDHVEKKVISRGAARDETLSFSFESSARALYYLVVKPFGVGHGDYELVIWKE